ncbi:molybdopterin-guanine dinucleotide biosynthesis protein B [Oceanobacillus arenosus]|uniref:Molybdopterin-guanine dinucleotide biosynthesis protein B n=1 Tax=Oceanobacillus arenosus TaxID=1229153 RepID=A0A3D8PY30_9BACI|nr:molybdopterin-guanine dinucleotide biosynthesis protein B [Oceanobacillus arenosus]RDW20168.1 molybdopterin-guanine dinucleotide biosynthesis protein B [Oceanobacillus arenosus]
MMKVIQIIGYKNSGKTTAAAALISALSEIGIRVASLKHHGHGGVPICIENTDSARHQRAGALVAGVEGEGMLQITSQNDWQLDKLIAIYQLLDIEVLVIEGFKQAPFKKVVMLDKEEDVLLLNESTNVLAVITSGPLANVSIDCPVFESKDLQGFCDWMIERLDTL